MKITIIGAVLLLMMVAYCMPALAGEYVIQGKEVAVSFSLPESLNITFIAKDGDQTREIGFNNFDHSVWGGVQVEYNKTRALLDPTEDAFDSIVETWNDGLAKENIKGKNITRFDLPYRQEVTWWGDNITVINTPYGVHTVEFRPPNCNNTIVTVIAPNTLLIDILDSMGFKNA